VEVCAKFRGGKREQWKWTLMILQPDFITGSLFGEAVKKAGEKKPSALFGRLRLETVEEDLSAQMMHVGLYREEETTVRKIHDFIEMNGYELHGKHHEIYLSDPRRTAPEKLRTIIRQPIRKRR
jgi:hypothetical protein